MFEEKTLLCIGAKISKDFRTEHVINQPRPPRGEKKTAVFVLQSHSSHDGFAGFDPEITAFENTFRAAYRSKTWRMKT